MSGGRPARTKRPDAGPTSAGFPIGSAGVRWLPLLLSVFVFTPALGCALAGGRATPESSATETGGPATIRVDNRSGFALSIHVISQDGNRRRLGSMGSFDTATFELPGSVLAAYSRFQLRADPTGSSTRYDSDPVIIRPGNTVTWTILTDSGRSTLSVESGGG